jgi:hypothetical protein
MPLHQCLCSSFISSSFVIASQLTLLLMSFHFVCLLMFERLILLFLWTGQISTSAPEWVLAFTQSVFKPLLTHSMSFWYERLARVTCKRRFCLLAECWRSPEGKNWNQSSGSFSSSLHHSQFTYDPLLWYCFVLRDTFVIVCFPRLSMFLSSVDRAAPRVVWVVTLAIPTTHIKNRPRVWVVPGWFWPMKNLVFNLDLPINNPMIGRCGSWTDVTESLRRDSDLSSWLMSWLELLSSM